MSGISVLESEFVSLLIFWFIDLKTVKKATISIYFITNINIS